MAQPQLTPQQLQALQALKAQGVGDEHALAIISGAAAPSPGILSGASDGPRNPFGLGAGIPQLPPPEAPGLMPELPQGQWQAPVPPVYGPVLSKLGGAIAAPFKAAAGVTKDTLQEGAALGQELGMRASGPNPRPMPPEQPPVAPQGVLAQAPVQPPPPEPAPPPAPVSPPPTPMQAAIAESPKTAPTLPKASAARRDTYAPLFQATGSKYGVDPVVLEATAWAESGFNPGAVSPAGAKGMMQFMDGTAQRFGIDPNDPAQAVDGAARYYQSLLKMFGGDRDKAIAAYNWGEGNVQKAVKQYGDNWLAYAPDETKAHVAKINRYIGGSVGAPNERAALGLPVGVEEMPPPPQGGGPSPGVLSQLQQVGQPQQQGVLAQGLPKSRADEFMERIYSSPWKGALYNALAAIADVDPYAHVEMLRQMDADDLEEFKTYQELHAPMDPLKAAQIREIEYKMQGGGGKEIKAQTWVPEAGGYSVLYEDSSAGFVPAAGAEYKPPSVIESEKKATEAQKEAALVGAEFDTNLQQLQEVMDIADQHNLYGVWPNNPVSKAVDYFGEQAPFNSEGAALRNEWRKRVNLAASTDAVTRLSQIGGSDTEKEFQWMLEMSPKITSNKSDFVAYMKMMQLARDKIRVREAGGLDEAARARFDSQRDAIIKSAKMDSYLE